jgi:hypothetical protein
MVALFSCLTPALATGQLKKMMARLRIPFLILLGLGLGVGLGLYLGWVAWPTEFTNANPAILETSYKQEYILMIADTYAADNNLPAAQRRINSLGPQANDLLIDLMLDAILLQQDNGEIARLVRLADHLGLYSPAMEPYLPTPEAGS